MYIGIYKLEIACSAAVVVKTMISRGFDTVFFVAGETLTTVFEALVPPGARLQSPAFAALGCGFGIPSWTVRKTEEFPGALANMMKTKGPALIHILLDPLDALAFFDQPALKTGWEKDFN